MYINPSLDCRFPPASIYAVAESLPPADGDGDEEPSATESVKGSAPESVTEAFPGLAELACTGPTTRSSST